MNDPRAIIILRATDRLQMFIADLRRRIARAVDRVPVALVTQAEFDDFVADLNTVAPYVMREDAERLIFSLQSKLELPGTSPLALPVFNDVVRIASEVLAVVGSQAELQPEAPTKPQP